MSYIVFTMCLTICSTSFTLRRGGSLYLNGVCSSGLWLIHSHCIDKMCAWISCDTHVISFPSLSIVTWHCSCLPISSVAHQMDLVILWQFWATLLTTCLHQYSNYVHQPPPKPQPCMKCFLLKLRGLSLGFCFKLLSCVWSGWDFPPLLF